MPRALLATLCAVVCAAVTARADVAPSPPWEPRDPVNWVMLLLSLFVAWLARAILLGVRAVWRRARRQDAKIVTQLPGVGAGGAAFIALVTLLLYGSFHVMQQLQRQEYVRQRKRIFEPKSNLGAIRSTQVAYFAEWNVYVGNQPLTPARRFGEEGRPVPWDVTTRFSVLGFAPEGDVWCSYALSGGDWPAGPEGFTATAECDLGDERGVRVYTVNHTSNEVNLSYRDRKHPR